MMKNYRIMRKLAIIFIVAVLAFPLVSASVLEKPDWREGDYWEYRVGYGVEGAESAGGEITTRILGTENVTIGNTTYHCIVAKEKVNASEKTVYYDEESLAVVKEISYDNETEEKIYDPPFAFIQYPIFIGKKWNATVEWKNTSIILQLECTGRENVSTRAGKFDCYVIKVDHAPNGTVNPDFYQVFYISGKAGNVVRTEGYANSTLVGYRELLSFHYGIYSNKQPDYAMVIPFIAVGIFILLLALLKSLYKFGAGK